MAKRAVEWTDTAKKQRRSILEYWARRNKSTAYPERLIELIRKRIEVIADNPFSGKQTNHSDVRESAMGKFSLYYRVTEEKLLVMAFWDNRQDPEKLLKALADG